jgi:hypothetical protein
LRGASDVRGEGIGTQPTLRGLGRLGDIPSRFGLVELPSDNGNATGYRRPHHALGVRSSTAEQWLREQSVDASGCLLPMVRMHTRLRSGQPNAALWFYARCDLR